MLQRFEEFLAFSFRGSVGSSWVKAGRYRITDEAAGEPLKAHEWKDKIKPGMVLSMTMVLRKPRAGPHHRCPSCEMEYVGAPTTELKRVRWYGDRLMVCLVRELTGEWMVYCAVCYVVPGLVGPADYRREQFRTGRPPRESPSVRYHCGP